MKIRYHTLGCKVNQQETAALEALFHRAGFATAGARETADIYLLNSCAVTAEAGRKGAQWLRRAKRENPAAVTVLTGCLPQAEPEKAAAMDFADIVTGTLDRSALPGRVQAFIEQQQGERLLFLREHGEKGVFETLPADQPEGRTRAFLKVQDGCDRFCAYCIIPYARGRVRWMPAEEVLAQLSQLAAAGYKEVVLTGINLSCYGNDRGLSLARIVEKAAEIPGLSRIRFGSVEPDLLCDEALAVLAASPIFCPHFHLSLQSGSDATLQRMGRRYDTAFYSEMLRKIRAALPGAQFTTDVIVGFPGETEEEFAQSLSYSERCGFLKIHVFPYSPRPGTRAATMADQVPGPVKKQRAAALQKAADIVQDQVLRRAVGTTHEVLLEQPVAPGLYTGYTKGYIPVQLQAPGHSQGDVVQIRLNGVGKDHCTGDLA